jgi:hypothetical protein
MSTPPDPLERTYNTTRTRLCEEAGEQLTARYRAGAVVAVNLFAYRATKPAALFGADVDIVGDLNNETIRKRSAAATITLAAWGSNPLAQARAAEVTPMLSNPQCVGTTKSGAPKHPLYIPTNQSFEPFAQRPRK